VPHRSCDEGHAEREKERESDRARGNREGGRESRELKEKWKNQSSRALPREMYTKGHQSTKVHFYGHNWE
jgi:hypothetical protein